MVEDNFKGLVSVGMPTRNRAFCIRRALDSLLVQSYTNFELIISDNASTDKTSEICQEYAQQDKRIKYFRQAINIGSFGKGGNFEFVLKRARGQYFMWASDDDIWNKSFIENCVRKLDENKEAVMAFTGVVGIDEEGEFLRYFFPKKFFPEEKDLYLRLKKYLLFYYYEGKANLIFGLWIREKILNNKLKNHWAADIGYIFINLIEGNFVLVNDFLFFKGLKKINPKRWGILSKICREIDKRILTVVSLYFYCYFSTILGSKKINLKNKFKLIACILSTIPRLFFRRY